MNLRTASGTLFVLACLLAVTGCGGGENTTGDDEGRTGWGGDGGALLLVEFARVIDLKMNFRVKRL